MQSGFFDRLILRDTHLPFSRTGSYTTVKDYQTVISLGVFQGENNLVKHNVKIGELNITDIPANRAGEEEIEVTFRYNINGMLEVSGKVLSTGKAVGVKINMMSYDAPKSRSQAVQDDLEWQNYTLAGDIKATVSLYQKKRSGLPPEAQKRADKVMRKIKEAVAANDADRVSALDDEITGILFEY